MSEFENLNTPSDRVVFQLMMMTTTPMNGDHVRHNNTPRQRWWRLETQIPFEPWPMCMFFFGFLLFFFLTECLFTFKLYSNHNDDDLLTNNRLAISAPGHVIKTTTTIFHTSTLTSPAHRRARQHLSTHFQHYHDFL